jgi:hypothetical protein
MSLKSKYFVIVSPKKGERKKINGFADLSYMIGEYPSSTKLTLCKKEGFEAAEIIDEMYGTQA